MKTKDFTITFSGLKLGSHEFNYDLDDTFFELFEFSDYSDLKGVAQMKMLKSETVLDLDFSFNGSITAPCDVTNEAYTQELANSFSMQVKFGEEYNDENDELLILPHGDHSFNIAQYLYELVVLSIPPKLNGPNAGNGLEDFIEDEEENENHRVNIGTSELDSETVDGSRGVDNSPEEQSQDKKESKKREKVKKMPKPPMWFIGKRLSKTKDVPTSL